MHFTLNQLLLLSEFIFSWNVIVSFDLLRDDHFNLCRLRHSKGQSMDDVKVSKMVSNYVTAAIDGANKDITFAILRQKRQIKDEISQFLGQIIIHLKNNWNLFSTSAEIASILKRNYTEKPNIISSFIDSVISIFRLANDEAFNRFLNDPILSASGRACVASAFSVTCGPIYEQSIRMHSKQLKPLIQIFEVISSTLTDMQNTIEGAKKLFEKQPCAHHVTKLFICTPACKYLLTTKRRNETAHTPRSGTTLEEQVHDKFRRRANSSHANANTNLGASRNQEVDNRNLSGKAHPQTLVNRPKNQLINLKKIQKNNTAEHKSLNGEPTNAPDSVEQPPNIFANLSSHVRARTSLACNQDNDRVLPLCRSHCLSAVRLCAGHVNDQLLSRFQSLAEKIKLFNFFLEQESDGRSGNTYKAETVTAQLFTQDFFASFKCIREASERCSPRLATNSTPESPDFQGRTFHLAHHQHIDDLSELMTPFIHLLTSFGDDVCASDESVISKDEKHCWGERIYEEKASSNNDERENSDNDNALKLISDSIDTNIKLLQRRIISEMQSDEAADETMEDLEQSGCGEGSGSGSGSYDDDVNFRLLSTKPLKANETNVSTAVQLTRQPSSTEKLSNKSTQLWPTSNHQQATTTIKARHQWPTTGSTKFAQTPATGATETLQRSPTLLHSFKSQQVESGIEEFPQQPPTTGLTPQQIFAASRPQRLPSTSLDRSLIFEDGGISLEETAKANYQNVVSGAGRMCFCNILCFLLFFSTYNFDVHI